MKSNHLLRWVALLLVGTVLLSFAACGDKNSKNPTTTLAPTQQSTTGESVTAVNANPGAWRVEVRGVQNVTSFTSIDAQYLPKVELEVTTQNEQGFTVTNKYGGVTLRSVLNLFGVTDVANVTVTSIDGITGNFPQNIAMAQDTILAWEMDGAPIDTEPPLRIIPRSGTPDQYMKLVTAIVVTAIDPSMTTTTPATYIDMTVSGYYPPIYTQYPNYTTYPNYTNVTYPPYTTAKTTTTKPTSTATTEPTTTVTTTSTTTTTTTTTRAPYVYPGPATPQPSKTTTTTSTTTASTASTTTVPTKPPDWDPNLPWSY